MNSSPYSDMDQPAYRVAYLIAGFIKNTLTEKEHDELDEWVNESDDNMKLFEDLTDESNVKANLEWMEKIQTEQAYHHLKEKIGFEKKKARVKRYPLWLAAASVALLIGLTISVWHSWEKQNPTTVEANTAHKKGSLPTKGPVLTLADGTVIDLSITDTGVIQTGDGISVNNASGQLSYENKSVATNSIHTLAIPIGMVYMLRLPDGTKVWLNASSTLKYPVQFSESERMVELNGEAYFEVAKNEKLPFVVKLSDGAAVKVLGTHFNVDAYQNQKEKKITLLEGSVIVSNKDLLKKLEPGTQADISGNGIRKKSVGNMDAIMSWKNGLFIFNDSPIETIMNKLEHWYGIKVVYKGSIQHKFNGRISQQESIEKILHLLELNGYVHFKKENNTIYVLP